MGKQSSKTRKRKYDDARHHRYETRGSTNSRSRVEDRDLRKRVDCNKSCKYIDVSDSESPIVFKRHKGRSQPNEMRGTGSTEGAHEYMTQPIRSDENAINSAKSQRIISHVDEERELKVESSRSLMAVNSYRSMRREKEWKRTLACKLFEERHHVDGGEGMDSLWEAYEVDSNMTKIETKTRMKKKIEVEFIDKYEEEEEVEIEPPLCCLQALKLSTVKMNLGVGIPNLMKITKAIKGIEWLHSVSKHNKKVHNNNGDKY